VTVSLSWVTAFDLTPPTDRPYAGSTKHNSMLELALMHNGLNRFMPRPTQVSEVASTDSGNFESGAAAGASNDIVSEARSSSSASLWDKTPTGPLRLLTPFHSAQMNWWMPFVIFAIALGGFRWHKIRQLTVNQSNIVIWGGWALGYTVVFSFAGGVFHTYYLAIVAPPLAALAGIGWAALWERYGMGSWRRGLPVALVVTAVWQLYIGQDVVHWALDDWRVWVLAASSATLFLAGATLTVLPQGLMVGPRMNGIAWVGLLATMVMPMAWSLSTVLARPKVAAPVANIAVLVGARNDDSPASAATDARTEARTRARKLISFLRANRHAERFLVAVPNAFQAAPLILRTGEPVMAMGGYLGRDPILTPDTLDRLVKIGEVRFVMLGGNSLGGRKTPNELALAEWIVAHGDHVDPALWRNMPDAAQPRDDSAKSKHEQSELFDLRPDSNGGLNIGSVRR